MRKKYHKSALSLIFLLCCVTLLSANSPSRKEKATLDSNNISNLRKMLIPWSPHNDIGVSFARRIDRKQRYLLSDPILAPRPVTDSMHADALQAEQIFTITASRQQISNDGGVESSDLGPQNESAKRTIVLKQQTDAPQLADLAVQAVTTSSHIIVDLSVSNSDLSTQNEHAKEILVSKQQNSAQQQNMIERSPSQIDVWCIADPVIGEQFSYATAPKYGLQAYDELNTNSTVSMLLPAISKTACSLFQQSKQNIPCRPNVIRNDQSPTGFYPGAEVIRYNWKYLSKSMEERTGDKNFDLDEKNSIVVGILAHEVGHYVDNLSQQWLSTQFIESSGPLALLINNSQDMGASWRRELWADFVAGCILAYYSFPEKAMKAFYLGMSWTAGNSHPPSGSRLSGFKMGWETCAIKGRPLPRFLALSTLDPGEKTPLPQTTTLQ